MFSVKFHGELVKFHGKYDEFISPSFPRRRESPKLSDGIGEIIEENDELIVWLYSVGQEIPAYAGMTVKGKKL